MHECLDAHVDRLKVEGRALARRCGLSTRESIFSLMHSFCNRFQSEKIPEVWMRVERASAPPGSTSQDRAGLHSTTALYDTTGSFYRHHEGPIGH
jgi:hypothetical protein